MPANTIPSQPPEHAIDIRGLTKTYKGSARMPPKTALDAVDLVVPRGSIFGLLGPNGAGKSTLINILAGLVFKTGGSASVWGHDIDTHTRRAKAAIGVVPQELNLDAFFTPFELMELQAGMYGVPKKERKTMELLSALGLADKAQSYARTLSGGMRRRLMVAKAMVHSPQVLVLDEPTAGVDVELRQSLWSYVRALNNVGTTVLLTTHYLEEAEEMCDRIAIINNGKVVANDKTPNLLRQLDSKEITITVDQEISALPEPLHVQGFEAVPPNQLRLRYQPSATKVGHVLLAVQAAGMTIVDVTTHETDLEDIFLQLTRSKAA
ncbi:MAG: ATP-binding cassette domain-containing protein [Alphaproteobacteria bacterium]|nr:ATP-binding cassette domain-containing protein [Alphaproteobacteria bacterium]